MSNFVMDLARRAAFPGAAGGPRPALDLNALPVSNFESGPSAAEPFVWPSASAPPPIVPQPHPVEPAIPPAAAHVSSAPPTRLEKERQVAAAPTEPQQRPDYQAARAEPLRPVGPAQAPAVIPLTRTTVSLSEVAAPLPSPNPPAAPLPIHRSIRGAVAPPAAVATSHPPAPAAATIEPAPRRTSSSPPPAAPTAPIPSTRGVSAITRSQPAAPARPDIHVRIGRVEIRAIVPPTAPIQTAAPERNAFYDLRAARQYFNRLGH